ncbi:MAG: uridylate kinase [Methylophilaceae bacterium]|nr:MAG: uridylate kinase [Methylophilaceae bacterium]
MWVIKLGGSLLGSEELTHWLNLIAKHGNGKVIIVPGGSVFADAVREAQKRSGVNDAVAHKLALLAMDQYGHLLAAMNPNLVTASSELELAECGWQHKGVIWLPSCMALADAGIPKNWQLTSDSLSAWLANKLGAEQLVLVKSKTFSSYQASTTLQTLVHDDLVDSEFASMASGSVFGSWLLHKTDYALFEQGFHVAQLKEKALLVNIPLR